MSRLIPFPTMKVHPYAKTHVHPFLCPFLPLVGAIRECELRGLYPPGANRDVGTRGTIVIFSKLPFVPFHSESRQQTDCGEWRGHAPRSQSGGWRGALTQRFVIPKHLPMVCTPKFIFHTYGCNICTCGAIHQLFPGASPVWWWWRNQKKHAPRHQSGHMCTQANSIIMCAIIHHIHDDVLF